MPRAVRGSQPPTLGDGVPARFVGRVGALAVVLGIGAAMAGSPGVAAADTIGSDSAPSSDTGSAPGAGSPTPHPVAPTVTVTTADSPDPDSSLPAAGLPGPPRRAELSSASAVARAASRLASTLATDQRSADVSAALRDLLTDAAARISPAGAVASAPKSAAREPDPFPGIRTDRREIGRSHAATGTLRARSVGSAGMIADLADAPGRTVNAATAGLAGRRAPGIGAATSAVLSPTPAAVAISAAYPAAGQPVSVPAADAAESAAPTATAPRSVGLIPRVLSALGLAPQATNEPTRPAQPPALWALLGWVRRELGAFTPSAISAVAPARPTVAAAAVDPVEVAEAVGPLGTPGQIAAEQLAAEVVNTLPMRLMGSVLKAGWLLTALGEFSAVGGPDKQNIAQLDDAVAEYAMAAAFQQQLLDSNNPVPVMQVAPPHSWFGMNVGGSRILYDNPDTVYRFMGVNGASSYVISGRFAPGAQRPAETTFSVLTGLTGDSPTVLSARDLEVNPDGTFIITASSAPAAPGQTNHLQLPPEATLIATRNTLSDWNTQEPMTLSIERVSGPPDSLFSQLGGFAVPGIGPAVVGNEFLLNLVSAIPPMDDPPVLLRGAVAAVLMGIGLIQEATYIAVATNDPVTGERRQPNVLSDPVFNAAFLATQRQSGGYFQLADDEALVVTVEPGNAGYFVLPVYNTWTITDNYWDHQTSLNNSQAVANPDGSYTLVISPTDPAVRNWVSTAGLNQGTIGMRFQDFDSDSSELPTVSSQVVALDDLPTVLPATTEYVTPAQRADQLAMRREGFENRFAPFSQP